MNLIIFVTLPLMFIYAANGISDRLFTGDFRAPSVPPKIVSDYQASFVQHKWDATDISHIASGMIYANLGLQLLRMDMTYDRTIASSLFDYENRNDDGTVPNYVYTLTPGIVSVGSCAGFNVTPAYPLFPSDILIKSKATFTGLVADNLFYSDQQPLQTWALSVNGASVTVFVDRLNATVRIDFSVPGGTFTTTRLFNVVAGPPDVILFANPCQLDDIR